MHDNLSQLVTPTSLSNDILLANYITIFLEQPSNIDKVGDKSSMLTPDFNFSVICIMEEQNLDISITHGFPNHTLVLNTMIGTPTKWFLGIPFTLIVGMYDENINILSAPNL